MKQNNAVNANKVTMSIESFLTHAEKEFYRSLYSAKVMPAPHRCESGYTFNGKVCKRFTAANERMCADCQSAVVIPATKSDRIANSLMTIGAILFAIVGVFVISYGYWGVK